VLLLPLLLAALAACVRYAAGQGLEWAREQGSGGYEEAAALAVFGEFLYVTGHTFGQLGAQGNAGQSDVFLSKWHVNGTLVWSLTAGTGGADYGRSVVVSDGVVYVAGASSGSAMVASWDSNGAPLWSWAQLVRSVVTGAVLLDGNMYVCGETSFRLPGNADAFVARVSQSAANMWFQLLFTEQGDTATAVATTDRAIFAVGASEGNLGGQINHGGLVFGTSADAFVSRWSTTGSTIWVRLVGTFPGNDKATCVVAQDGRVFLAGVTNGNFPNEVYRGGEDVFVASFAASNGDRLWLRQMGSSADDVVSAVALSEGFLFCVGSTRGDLGGRPHGSGDWQLFVVRMRLSGDIESTDLLVYSASDRAFAAIAFQGFLMVAGATAAEQGNAFLAKVQPCAPSCSAGLFGICNCEPCAAGRFSLAIGAVSSQTCQPCTVGHACPAGTPAPLQCAAGFFSAAPGASVCTPCAAGRFSTIAAATSAAVCESCGAGTFCPANSSGPALCPTGSYCPVDSGAPTPCAAGTWSNGTGLVSQSNCSVCPAGHYCVAGSAVPAPCPYSTFNPEPAQGAASSCTSCPFGQITTSPARTSATECTDGRPASSSATLSERVTQSLSPSLGGLAFALLTFLLRRLYISHSWRRFLFQNELRKGLRLAFGHAVNDVSAVEFIKDASDLLSHLFGSLDPPLDPPFDESKLAQDAAAALSRAFTTEILAANVHFQQRHLCDLVPRPCRACLPIFRYSIGDLRPCRDALVNAVIRRLGQQNIRAMVTPKTEEGQAQSSSLELPAIALQDKASTTTTGEPNES
jgi:hypothetical protein